ncbi:MAG: isoprenylcysteine carboxylmethyltransferase family protein [Burkholderiaceae bacterium]
MTLDARIPPPAIAIAAALIIWGIAHWAPQMAIPGPIRLATALVLVALGVACSVAGVIAFRRAHTTVNPTTPDAASSLVRTGIYRFTRNPMYLGLLLILCGWAIFLSSLWGLLGAGAFVLYLNAFQIAPEERALARIFGSTFAAYTASVRRWL